MVFLWGQARVALPLVFLLGPVTGFEDLGIPLGSLFNHGFSRNVSQNFTDIFFVSPSVLFRAFFSVFQWFHVSL